ncbi:putative secreted protein (Por secretion system target) [Marinoscillum furvescens DSM 4134]|uniref:Putative secreted protein (Por secretion system target) n=2 Tax=Marinoscillum furvescens TaxID=1026 RepID=A0A3D9L0J3_MARFU|nr:putative secreted protein (Por secretion system target) [Marinoscillum furvescens DSM 4134]
MRVIIFICLILSTLYGTSQANFVPDPGMENGTISGANSDYYYYNGSVLWRAWPFIGFETDQSVKNSGERSLKIVYKNYGSTSFEPTFRLESFPALEDGTYKFSFYYQTDIDRSNESITVRIHEGVSATGSTKFYEEKVPILAGAKDGFKLVEVEFSTGKAMDGIVPFIVIPFISEGAYLHIDDVSLIRVVESPKSWGPSPVHTATGVPTNTRVSWQNGKGAVKHDVYFGTNTSPQNKVLSETSENQYLPPTLENGTTYYWRVDEIDSLGTVTAGDVWSFTTKTYVEEFEDQVKTERMESGNKVEWEQFGPGNSGFVNFLRYHPLLPDVCLTSPDMGNTYQTEDNGKTWTTVKDVDGSGEFFRIYDAFYSTKTAAFAIAIESSRLWVSRDTGRSWQNIKHCPWYDGDGEGNDTRSWYRKVSTVAIDPSDDNTWYVGAGNHCRGQQHLWGSVKDANASNPRGVESNNMGVIWKTTDAGQTWQELSDGIHAKAQFARIIVHPTNPDVVFAGSQYGLYKSVDGGATWTDIGEGNLDNNTVMNMDYYYNATSGKFVLYVADQVRYYPDGNSTRNDGGIFRSEDDGETWININGDLYLDINQLSGGVADNYYKYIAKWFGITAAEAKSQYPTKPTNALQYFNSLNVDPSREDVLYVGFYDAQIQYSITPGRLWQTKDGGQHWKNIAREFQPAWEADKAYWESRDNPYHDNMVMGHAPFTQQWGNNYPLRSLRYAAVNSRGDIMILFAHNTLLSTDDGVSFEQVDETYTANGNIMGNGNSNLPGQCLWQDKRLGEGVLYLGSGEHHLWKTTLDGENGKQAVKYLDGSQESVFAVVTHPWDEKTVYTTSMRQKHLDRIYKSTDGGETFVDWGKATEASEWMRTNHLRIDPINPEYMYFGVTEVAGAGGGSGTDGPDKDKEGGFHKSTDGGRKFAPSNSGMPEKVWVRDIEFDPRDDARKSLFVAAPWNAEVKSNGGLFHSTDRGETWQEIVVSDKLEGINNVHFDHTGRMYATGGRRAAGLDGGGLFYSDDYGATWHQLFDAPFVDNFDVSPFDHNLLVLTNSKLTKNPGVYISLDRGQTWTKSNHNLGQPDVITQVEFDLHDPTRLWMSVMGSGFYKGFFPEGQQARKLKITPGASRLDDGDSLQLAVERLNDWEGDFVFKSGNQSVATVSDKGMVKAVAPGAVKIWVTSADGRYSDFVHLVVLEVAVTGVEINEEDFVLDVDKREEKQLTATVFPKNATNQEVTWSSSKPSVASVNESGLVKSIAKGEAEIRVASVDGSFTDVVKVTVTTEEKSLLSAENPQFSVYPNPSSDRVNITGVASEYVEVSVYSVSGLLVKDIGKVRGHSFSIADLATGVYVAKIRADGEEVSVRLVKE